MAVFVAVGLGCWVPAGISQTYGSEARSIICKVSSNALSPLNSQSLVRAPRSPHDLTVQIPTPHFCLSGL